MKRVFLFLAFACFYIHTSAMRHKVFVDGCSFNPSVLNIVVGDTVTWILDHNSPRATTSMNIPNGAIAWNETLSEENPEYNYVFTIAGEYTYKSMILPTCIAFIRVSETTSLDEYAESLDNIIVFPNPAKDILNIQLIKNIKNFTIIDLNGRQIYEAYCRNKPSAQLDLSAFSNGTYIILFFNDSGLIEKRKFIIEK